MEIRDEGVTYSSLCGGSGAWRSSGVEKGDNPQTPSCENLMEVHDFFFVKKKSGDKVQATTW